MYFKVIKSGTNRKLVYDFLLVVYSNICRITHRFWEIWCKTVQWPWNMPKVIDSRITWKLSCKMYVKCSEDSERMKWKSPFSTTPFSIGAPSPANPREYLHKPYTIVVLPETTFPGLHFCRWQYMGSSANFRTVLSESRRRQPITTVVAEPETDFNAKWPFKVIQGHLFRYHWRATNELHSKI